MKTLKMKIIALILLITMWACHNGSNKPHHLAANLTNNNLAKAKNYHFSLDYANKYNVKQLYKNGQLTLICFGIFNNDYSHFEKKYGIRVKTEACVVTPYYLKTISSNNLAVGNFLTGQFGESWQKDLGFIPMGINNGK